MMDAHVCVVVVAMQCHNGEEECKKTLIYFSFRHLSDGSPSAATTLNLQTATQDINEVKQLLRIIDKILKAAI